MPRRHCVYEDWGKIVIKECRWFLSLKSTLFFSDASLSNDNPVMAFHDMAGVFYVVGCAHLINFN